MRTPMVGSAASATGGPLTAAGASLGGRGAAASLAASGAAPGEAGEGRLAAEGRLEAMRGPEAGKCRDWHTGLHPGLV